LQPADEPIADRGRRRARAPLAGARRSAERKRNGAAEADGDMAETQAGEGEEATGVAPAADAPAADAPAADAPAADTPAVDTPAAEADLVGDTLGYLARSLVANTDDVRIEKLQTERGLVYRLHVNPDDMGRVIGRSGRI